ncbi:MAG TPA: MFS transporter [bacterium]|nr:MFS transporter [bacterium]
MSEEATESLRAGAPAQSLFRQRPFVLFWIARVAATLAFQMQAVAVGWQMYALTGSPLQLGLVGLAQFIPVVLLALFVGHAADRYDRKRIVRACQTLESLAAAALAAGSFGGWLTPGLLLAIVFVVGSARAFELPTLHALLPGLVPPSLFSRAVAGSASANQTAAIVGPALGGLLYVLGPGAVYAACAAVFLAASLLVALIRAPANATERKRVTLELLFGGVTYIRRRPVLLGVISLDLFAVLLGGATALLPVYARDVLGTGPWGLGVLRSAPALGALFTSLVLARHPLRSHAGKTLFAAVAVFGVATSVFALSAWLWLSLAALVVLGAADAVSVVIRFSLVQVETPDEMRGRVSTVNSMFIGTSNTLGEFESGVTAAWFGAVPAVLIGGIGTLLVALLWMRLFPQLLRVENLEPSR